MIEVGWVIKKEEFLQMTSILSQEEIESKPVQALIDKFLSNC